MDISSKPIHKLKRPSNTIIKKRKKTITPVWVLRTASILLIAGMIVSGTVFKSGFGRLCTLGKGIFSMTCPLGFLGAAFASRSLLPKLWLSVGVAVLLIILLGRFFCAWVCPASILHFIKTKLHIKTSQSALWQSRVTKNEKISSTAVPAALTTVDTESASKKVYPGVAVLVGGIVSSYIFGFPVFCLVCPIGLTFGTIFAAVRWFSGATPGLELAIFPIMIIAEIFILKSWCTSLCPMGALFGLISRLNIFFRPKPDQKVCLGARGFNCRVCEKACPQGLTRAEIMSGTNEKCTKCLECYEKCPAGAIRIKAIQLK